MLLLCIAPYRNRDVVFAPGEQIVLSDPEARKLLADGPGAFRVLSPGAAREDWEDCERVVDAPPLHRQVRRVARKK